MYVQGHLRRGTWDGMCAPNHHTVVDTDELGELNVTLEMDSKKNYKRFIKTGLQLLSMFLIA